MYDIFSYTSTKERECNRSALVKIKRRKKRNKDSMVYKNILTVLNSHSSDKR